MGGGGVLSDVNCNRVPGVSNVDSWSGDLEILGVCGVLLRSGGSDMSEKCSGWKNFLTSFLYPSEAK